MVFEAVPDTPKRDPDVHIWIGQAQNATFLTNPEIFKFARPGGARLSSVRFWCVLAQHEIESLVWDPQNSPET